MNVKIFRMLLISCSLLFVLIVNAGSTHYHSRPVIEDISGSRDKTAPDIWHNAKDAIMFGLAQFVHLYPTEILVFLARDGEYIYDAARILFQDHPEHLNRIKLLNISRLSYKTDTFKNYLTQEGIVAKGNNKYIFIDTGFDGTIYEGIQNYMSKKLWERIKFHFLLSNHHKVPSSRVFMSRLIPGGATWPIHQQHNLLVNFEHLPHYTNRASGYKKNDKKYIVTTESDYYGKDEEGALRLMSDLKYFFNLRKQKDKFANTLDLMEKLISEIIQKGALSSSLEVEAKKIFGTETLKSLHNDITDAVAKKTLSIKQTGSTANGNLGASPEFLAAQIIGDDSLVLPKNKISNLAEILSEIRKKLQNSDIDIDDYEFYAKLVRLIKHSTLKAAKADLIKIYQAFDNLIKEVETVLNISPRELLNELSSLENFLQNIELIRVINKRELIWDYLSSISKTEFFMTGKVFEEIEKSKIQVKYHSYYQYGDQGLIVNTISVAIKNGHLRQALIVLEATYSDLESEDVMMIDRNLSQALNSDNVSDSVKKKYKKIKKYLIEEDVLQCKAILSKRNKNE